MLKDFGVNMTEEQLVESVRRLLSESGSIREMRMFGGVGFMLDGNLVTAISKRGLLLRLGRDRQTNVMSRPGVRPMEMRGRQMKDYVYVDPDSIAGEAALKSWINQASAFVHTLPPKDAPSPRRKSRKTSGA
jgi:TfoX/Sxy family transcriptional regulator of competence genes